VAASRDIFLSLYNLHQDGRFWPGPGGKIEMEEKFCSVALDIIGLSVFNYDFGSVMNKSPVIKAVYSALVHNYNDNSSINM
jgi:hypothetical protein